MARKIQVVNGHNFFNKNPRILHAKISCFTNRLAISEKLNLELKASEKILVRKEILSGFSPDLSRLLINKQLDGYVSWLSARYSRPALPTEFNNRISAADKKNKRRAAAKKLSAKISGLYVKIYPNKEIQHDDNYEVMLLGIVSSGYKGNITKIEKEMAKYAAVMRSAKMDVTVIVRKENEISLSDFREFQRFYYDDLSIKDGTESPLENKI